MQRRKKTVAHATKSNPLPDTNSTRSNSKESMSGAISNVNHKELSQEDSVKTHDNKYVNPLDEDKKRRHSSADAIDYRTIDVPHRKNNIRKKKHSLPPINLPAKSWRPFDVTNNNNFKFPRLPTFADNGYYIRRHTCSIEEEPPSSPKSPEIKLKVNASSEFNKVMLDIHEFKLT